LSVFYAVFRNINDRGHISLTGSFFLILKGGDTIQYGVAPEEPF
jgi:hypothetical protein